jgi:hypothetical protein
MVSTLEPCVENCFLSKFRFQMQFVRYVAAHARAVRNCPTHGDTWAAAMRAAEQRTAGGVGDAGDDPTSTLMEAALGAGLSSGDDYLAVFIARLDVLRRRGDGRGLSRAYTRPRP